MNRRLRHDFVTEALVAHGRSLAAALHVAVSIVLGVLAGVFFTISTRSELEGHRRPGRHAILLSQA